VVVLVGLAVSAVRDNDAEVDVIETHDVSQSVSSASADVDGKEDACIAGTEAAPATAINNVDNIDDQTDSSTSVSAEHLDTESHCFLRQLSDTSQRKSGALFLKSSWRQHLCSCPSCLVSWMYFYVDLLLSIHFCLPSLSALETGK